MDWMTSIGSAIEFIEDNIDNDLTIEVIAKHVNISPFYFQKAFVILCGFSVSEYVKRRRLSLAGSELIFTDNKIIDIALKYGYDSPDSFAKAFARFHGATPSAVRKGESMIKSFAPLKIKFVLQGGFTMDYKIVSKDAFTVVGVSKVFKYEEAIDQVPKMWQEFHNSDAADSICAMYGINNDASMSGDVFEYMIADNYNPSIKYPDTLTTKVIPKHNWAVFACKGKMPEVIQDVNKKIFTEWLPNSNDYEIAEGYNIELYDNPKKFANGTRDDNYYSEIWIPVSKKLYSY